MAEKETTYLNFRPTFPVADLERAIAFYRDVLGMRLDVHEKDMGLAIFRSDTAEVALFKTEPAAPQRAYLVVEGVEALHGHIAAASPECIVQALNQTPWGLYEFVVRDPDGHLFGVGEWRSTGPTG